jgi:hypothetical protein
MSNSPDTQSRGNTERLDDSGEASAGSEIQESRDEREARALADIAVELMRLDGYERGAPSRQKSAIRAVRASGLACYRQCEVRPHRRIW